MKELVLGGDVSVPFDAVTETFGWVGNRGSGKTHGAKVMAEEMLKAGCQVVVIDPVDAWYGLRYGRTKKDSGLPIYVFGGEHQDAPLEPTAGALLADVVVEQGISAVFSLRHLPKGRQRHFVQEFAERLYLRKGESQYRTAVHVFIEEAHTFAPQGQMQLKGADAGCLGAIQDLVLQGRGSGIGVSLITQRVATLSRAVLELAEVLCAFRTTGPNARKALKVWFDAQDADGHLREFLEAITSLPRGQCWLWSPGYLNRFEQVSIRQAETFDSSATPEPGEARPSPAGKAAQLDLDALGDRIRETVERQEANDPARLKRIIEDLRGRLEAAEQPLEIRVEEVLREQTPIAVVEAARDLASAAAQLKAVARSLNDGVGNLDTHAQALLAAVQAEPTETRNIGQAFTDGMAHAMSEADMKRAAAGAFQHVPKPKVPGMFDNGTLTGARSVRPKAPPVQVEGVPEGLADGDGGVARILQALAPFPNGMSMAQLANRSKLKKTGGTFSTYISRLKGWGLLDVTGSATSGHAALTGAGQAYVGARNVSALSGKELRDDWAATLGEKSGERRMYDALVADFPYWMGREQLADAAALSLEGGTFGTYLSRLRSNGLIEEGENGAGVAIVRASSALFEEGEAA